ncbi:Gfo/Idh/MocA family oxidoreductase [Halorussus salilacus]|uniref:Gfo/Idh/MocA family protein n=1 Tax=Halorussus salilacus TaxID=2953750 RepID=UPI0020A19642|nr:Gfo/Idh/MocA family oxidoreductase [Halorussus salilacus]USZ69289.1 Gfo/Idh/MocA family oxidoreductase [Halorussus salilacus]
MGIDTEVAIVGLGWMGKRIAEQYNAMDGVTLLAGADTDPDAREAFGDEYGVETYGTCERVCRAAVPDAVIVATPHPFHYEQVMAAIDHGTSVLVEKPMVVDPEHAIEIENAARAASVEVRVGYHRRFNPAYRAIKDALDDGEIGGVSTISCRIGLEWVDINESQWRMDPSVTGDKGYLYDMGSHLLEALLWATGARVESVAAVGSDSFDVDVNTAVSAALRIDGRTVPATVTLCGESTAFDADETLTVWGTDGRLTYRSAPASSADCDVVRVTQPEGTEVSHFREGTDFEAMTREKLEAFAAAVRGDDSRLTDYSFARRLTRVRAAISEARESGESVPVECRTPTANH